MMACPEFEELLKESGRGHAESCEACRALLDGLGLIDATFEAAFAGVSAPSGLDAAVRARIARELQERRPSPLPELLDLIGWAAVLAVVAIAGPRFLSLLDSVLAGYG